MTDTNKSRRRFLQLASTGLVGAALAGQGVPVGAEEGDWTVLESPTEETLQDAVQTSRGPFAVGGSGYALLRRNDGWDTVLERGPTTESNPLRGVGATDDGEHVWFAGGSGVVGRYDVENDQLTDHSAPKEKKRARGRRSPSPARQARRRFISSTALAST